MIELSPNQDDNILCLYIELEREDQRERDQWLATLIYHHYTVLEISRTRNTPAMRWELYSLSLCVMNVGKLTGEPFQSITI